MTYRRWLGVALMVGAALGAILFWNSWITLTSGGAGIPVSPDVYVHDVELRIWVSVPLGLVFVVGIALLVVPVRPFQRGHSAG